MHQIRRRWSPSRIAESTSRRSKALTLGAVVAVIAICGGAPTGAQAAPPAPVYNTFISFEGHGNLAPFYDLIVTWGDNTSAWQEYSVASPGPLGYSYRMYKYKATGLCLDVKGGVTTAGAELTTSPCQPSRNSQWWSDGGGTLTNWDAAGANLVATHHVPGGWNFNRLVLAARVGPTGSTAQRPFRIWTQVIPH